MSLTRSLLVAACLLAACTAGCSSFRQQFRQAVQEMKADAAILDSADDGLDALAPGDAKHLRAARADMER